MKPKPCLHLEGLAVFALSLFLYWKMEFSGTLLLVLILAPDISIIAYLFSYKFGAILYNLLHTYTYPLILVAAGIFFHYELLITIALIWIMHIGIDRFLGFGLKYKTSFKDTHLGRL